MGIERARVVEVDGRTGGVGAGYVVGDRLVLTSARLAATTGATRVRPAGTATWISASTVWTAPAGAAAVLQLDEPGALMLSPERVRWGRITGARPVPVTGMGFGPADVPVAWPRDAEQFLGHVVPGNGIGDGPLAVTTNPAVGAGMSGAALFAGAELVGVLVAGARPQACTVAAMAAHGPFVDLFGDGGELALTPVSTPSSGFPILAV
jgi:hypothetical protein